MVKVNPDAPALITEHIAQMHQRGREICTRLRKIIFKAAPGIIEDWKWGPNYRINNMILGYGSGKGHVSLAFFRGDLMKDSKKLFTSGFDNAHNRMIRFEKADDINEKALIQYIKEAVKLDAMKIPVVKNKNIPVPPDFKKALQKARILDKFEQTNFTNRKEYVGWVTGAKKEETRRRRIEKAVEKISAGIKFS